MKDLWRLRAIRQLTLGLAPLLVIGVAVLIALSIKGSEVSGRLREATGRADGVVQRIDSSHHASITWTDRDGMHHTSRIGYPADNAPDRGATVLVHYVPDNPSKAYAPRDSTYASADSLTGGVVYLGLLLLIVVIATAVRIGRRTATAKRPTTPVRLSRVRTRLGVIQRSWLVVSQGRQEHWVPVFWQPELSGLLGDTPAKVHGDPQSARVLDLDGTVIWSSGRARQTPPRGRHQANPGTYGRKAPGGEVRPISLAAQARRDGTFIAISPVLGAIWMYVNGLGAAGFGLATAVLAGLLFWIPSTYGSDPT